MHHLPANFLRRTDLQVLAIKASELIGSTDSPELALGLHRVMTAAIGLDALLSELPPSKHPADKAALGNPHGWKQEWNEQIWEFEIGTVRIAQEHMVHGNRRIPTERYRVTIGDEHWTSFNKADLEQRVIGFLFPHWETLPQRLIDSCLACLH